MTRHGFCQPEPAQPRASVQGSHQLKSKRGGQNLLGRIMYTLSTMCLSCTRSSFLNSFRAHENSFVMTKSAWVVLWGRFGRICKFVPRGMRSPGAAFRCNEKASDTEEACANFGAGVAMRTWGQVDRLLFVRTKRRTCSGRVAARRARKEGSLRGDSRSACRYAIRTSTVATSGWFARIRLSLAKIVRHDESLSYVRKVDAFAESW